jgi:hypothetical protein
MLKHCVVTVFAVALSTTAFGQAKFRAEQSVLGYSSSTSETKPDGGTAVKSSKTEMVTSMNSLRLGASWDKMSFYVYPTTNTHVEAGYWVMDNLEAGLGLSLNSSTGKVGDAKSNSSKNTYGVWGTYYMPMGSASLEANFSFLMGSNTGKDTDAAGVETKTNETSTMVNLGANYVMPLAKNFSWLGGLSYAMNNGEDKEGKTKTTATELGLNLTTLRWNW